MSYLIVVSCFFRMLYEERNKKKEKKEADVFAAMERRKSQNQEKS